MADRGHKASKRLTARIITAVMAAIILLTGGCIHTYPNEELDPDKPTGIDPTDLHLQLIVNVADTWVLLSSPRRVTIAATDHSGHVSTGTFTVYHDEIKASTFTLALPGLFHADKYRLDIWIDYLNPSAEQPMGYDISSLSLIKPLMMQGEESDYRQASVYHGEINLNDLPATAITSHGDTSDPYRTATLHIPMHTAMGRFRLVATDYTEFLQYTEEARRRGERYNVTVDYLSPLPGAFNLYTDAAVMPLDNISCTSELTIIDMPGINMPVASDWIFTDPDSALELTLRVSLYNSSQVLMARTDNVAFNVERGKVTTVSGAFLTKLITGGLQIDTRWDDEEFIDL